MKKRMMVLALAMATLAGCAYGGITAVGGNNVVVTKNDGLLFGAMRAIFVCKATTGGLTNCKSAEAP